MATEGRLKWFSISARLEGLMSEVDDMRVPNGKLLEWIKVVAPVLALALTAIVLPMIRWTYSEMEEINKRLAVIEANRFTAEDGMDLYRALANKVNRQDVPPPEVRNDIGEIKMDIREMRQIMQEYHGGGP